MSITLEKTRPDVSQLVETNRVHGSVYTDEALFQAELEAIWYKGWVYVGHESEGPANNDFVMKSIGPQPVIMTRDNKGQIHLLQNRCSHRGNQVCLKDKGNARAFTCPYHSWTYGLDGKLRGIPQPAGFEGVDRSQLGLVELPAWERFGLIWVMPSVPQAPVDIDAWLAPMAEQLQGLDLGGHHVFRNWDLRKNMSWRLLLEGFQESYHFCHAHRETACSAYLDNQSVHLNFNPHVRHAVPLPKIEELRGTAPETWDYRPYFLTQNYLFPANFVQVQTDHVYIHTVIPTGVDSCVFQCMMLTPQEPVSEKALRYYTKNFDLIRIVFNEDFEIGEGIQKGLNTGANAHFLFGKYECGLQFGQRAIDAALDGQLKMPSLG